MFTHRTLLLLLGLVATASAVAQTRVSVAPESQLWIEGTSTINEFKCVAGRIEGEATLHRAESEAEALIPVGTFDCGKSRMNKDFYRALKANEHPHIRFELLNASVADGSGAAFNVTVNGRLTIAGVTRDVTVVAQGRKQEDGGFRVLGRLPLSMKDFDIEPPTAFAGLIRAHERIVVGFDLTAEIDGATTVRVCGPDSNILC